MPLDEAEKAQVLARIERMQALMAELEYLAGTEADRALVRERINKELEAAKQTLNRLATHDPA